MKTLTVKNTFCIAVLGAAMTMPAISNATVNDNNKVSESTTLKISDLDLSQEKGIATLYERLKSSANKVCGDKDIHVIGSRVESNKFRRAYKRCYARALNGAVNSINNARLTEMHSDNS
ncbi:MAG: UrcA family protein [Gammaproteobacteria bacterium]|nr:UrcA family protein [Gammaproteobacteria bacterium]